MATLAAVVGIGQTHYKTRRSDVSIAGLVREAAVNALADAGLGWEAGCAPGWAPGCAAGALAGVLPHAGAFPAGSVGAAAVLAAGLLQAAAVNNSRVRTTWRMVRPPAAHVGCEVFRICCWEV